MGSIFGDVSTTFGESPEGQEELEAGAPEGEEIDDQDTDLDGDEGAEGEYDDSADEDDDSDDDGDGEPPADGQGEEDPVAALGFKSAADLAKSYKELRKTFTQSRQQQPAGQPGQPSAGQQQQPADGQGAQDLNQVFWNNFRENPMGTLQYLIQQSATQLVQQSVSPLMEDRQTEQLSRNIESVAKDYRQIGTPEGMQQLMEKVQEIAEQDFGNPGLANNPSPRLLRLAAQELFGDSKAKVFQKAKQKGRQEAEEARRRKQGLGAPAGSRKPAAPQAKSVADEIGDSIVKAGRGGGIFGS
ncbi:hypothetical protein [Gorillibacterium sp. sgz5001074]|uniref:hypothetical protein n=1 Tax=Gorillibacterium sp. sgz5001074 TaxID=3446695 RepID=UPI003F66C22A